MGLDPNKYSKMIGKLKTISRVGVNAQALTAGSPESSQSAAKRCAFTADSLKSLSEDAWSEVVEGVAVSHGWEAAHCRKVLVKDGKKKFHYETPMPAGWTDWVFIRCGVIVFAELKTEDGELSEAQRHYHWLLAAAARRNPFVFYKLWRPGDYDDVVATLGSPPPE